MQEVSPEAVQKLAEIKSKIEAGTELSEQEKKDLATVMQEIALREYEYLDEQHKKELDKILESANNQQPKLPAP
jgi:tRNA U54 and U55 pseudouridine synthase Pus10